MSRRKFFIKTMGCQMNEYDSDLMAQDLILMGWERAEDMNEADLIIVNTCTVREKPEHKAYSFIGRAIAVKKRRPAAVVAVTGCLAQQRKEEIIERFPEVDMVVGAREVVNFSDYLKELLSSQKKIVATCLDTSLRMPALVRGFFKGKVTAYVSIMQGCNNFCSYCIVPYVRGREISRPVDEILKEIEFLISEGVREITLLGQNVNSYKWKDIDFPKLLREVSKIRNLWRLRFTTSHPKDLSDELIKCFEELDNLCSHMHLPFQSGSNRILRLMNRNYTREKYVELVDKLRKARPDIAITADVMVGFPGETEKDFLDTIDLIKRVEFDGLFSFKYTDRPGTRAEKMKDKVDEREKGRRLEILQKIQKEITLKKNKKLEGKEVEVLVEGYSKRGNMFMGRTSTNKIVNFYCNFNAIGNLVKVKVEEAFANSLRGRYVSTVMERDREIMSDKIHYVNF